MNKKEIEKKASELSKEYAITIHNDGYDVTEYPDVTMLYKMAEWMYKKMYWKARKAFCKATCGECPLNTDDIEGGGGLVVQCDKLEMFDKELTK